MDKLNKDKTIIVQKTYEHYLSAVNRYLNFSLSIPSSLQPHYILIAEESVNVISGASASGITNWLFPGYEFKSSFWIGN